jgi:hypothetical protein
VHEPDSLTWLQAWYASQCNGDWEHEYGVSIETLDNPGWLLKLDLQETGMDGLTFAKHGVLRMPKTSSALVTSISIADAYR